MPPEPFQTVRGHRQKWHLNRSKPSEGTRKNDTWTVPNRSTGGHLYWLILDHILLLFLMLISFDIDFLLITCHFIFFDVYLMILWCFGHQSNQTSQIKTSKPLGILTQAVPQGGMVLIPTWKFFGNDEYEYRHFPLVTWNFGEIKWEG